MGGEQSACTPAQDVALDSLRVLIPDLRLRSMAVWPVLLCVCPGGLVTTARLCFWGRCHTQVPRAVLYCVRITQRGPGVFGRGPCLCL